MILIISTSSPNPRPKVHAFPHIPISVSFKKNNSSIQFVLPIFSWVHA